MRNSARRPLSGDFEPSADADMKNEPSFSAGQLDAGERCDMRDEAGHESCARQIREWSERKPVQAASFALQLRASAQPCASARIAEARSICDTR
jgi:hypothetical protein